jgi:hypothetical protein
LVQIWDELVGFKDVQVAEITLTVTDRDSFDNTLLATWADRPTAVRSHVSVIADGQREINGKQESVHLVFEGRFEEVRTMLPPSGLSRIKGNSKSPLPCTCYAIPLSLWRTVRLRHIAPR